MTRVGHVYDVTSEPERPPSTRFPEAALTRPACTGTVLLVFEFSLKNSRASNVLVLSPSYLKTMVTAENHYFQTDNISALKDPKRSARGVQHVTCLKRRPGPTVLKIRMNRRVIHHTPGLRVERHRRGCIGRRRPRPAQTPLGSSQTASCAP